MTGNTEVTDVRTMENNEVIFSPNGSEKFEKVGEVTNDNRDFLKIEKRDFEALLTTLPFPVTEADHTEYGAKEYVYESPVNGGGIKLVIYSGIDVRNDKNRAYASDAIRVNLVHSKSGHTLAAAPHTKRRENYAKHFHRKAVEMHNDAPEKIRTCPDCGGFLVRVARKDETRERQRKKNGDLPPKHFAGCLNWWDDHRPVGVEKCEYSEWDW